MQTRRFVGCNRTHDDDEPRTQTSYRRGLNWVRAGAYPASERLIDSGPDGRVATLGSERRCRRQHAPSLFDRDIGNTKVAIHDVPPETVPSA